MTKIQYKRQTGAAIATFAGSFKSNPAVDFGYLDGWADPDQHWIDAGQIVEREDWSSAFSVGLILPAEHHQPIVNGLPPLAWVSVRGTANMNVAQSQERADENGQLALVVSEAGTYVVTLVGQYRGADVRVEVTTLDDLKERRCAAVDAHAETIITFQHMGHSWNYNTGSRLAVRQAWLDAHAVNDVPVGYYWTDADNNNVPITIVELLDLVKAYQAFDFALHSFGRSLKDQIKACTTMDEVLAINVGDDWPA